MSSFILNFPVSSLIKKRERGKLTVTCDYSGAVLLPAGESTCVTHDAYLTEIGAGPKYTSRYFKGDTAVAERANQILALSQTSL